MEKWVITGATGHLGGLTIRHLLDLVVAPSDIAAVVRDSGKAKTSALADQGIEIRRGDYDDPPSLVEAFRGASRLLFVSAPSHDNTLRIRQHAHVVKAARNAGVGHIVYTSIAFSEKLTIGVENVHLATEYMIKTTSIPYTFLRNAFYLDSLINERLHQFIEKGEIINAAGNGKLNLVTRNNLALAAAKVLTSSMPLWRTASSAMLRTI